MGSNAGEAEAPAMGYRCVSTTGAVQHKAEVQSKMQREKLFSDTAPKVLRTVNPADRGQHRGFPPPPPALCHPPPARTIEKHRNGPKHRLLLY